MIEATIARVKALKVMNFRGLIGEHNFNLDADLVLIEGPNGHGKSSLLEALLWLVTGHHYYHSEKGYSMVSRRLDETTQGAVDHSIVEGICDCFLAEDEDQCIDAVFKSVFKPDDKLLQVPQCTERGLTVGTKINNKPIDRELAARLCSFYQDNMSIVFDDAASGQKLQEAVHELPPSVDDARDQLERLVERLISERAGYSDPQASESDLPVFLQCCHEFSQCYEVLRKDYFGDWLAWRPVGELDEWEELIADFLAKYSKNEHRGLPGWFFAVMEKKIKQKIDDLNYEDVNKRRQDDDDWKAIDEKIKKNQFAINEIEEAWPELENELELFRDERLCGTGSAGDDRRARTVDTADVLFDILADKAEQWGRETSEMLTLVKREFGQVDKRLAAQCSKAIRDWLAPRREAWAEKNRLKQEKEALEIELEKYRLSQQAIRLKETWDGSGQLRTELKESWEKERVHREAQSQKRARAYLDQHIDLLTQLKNSLEYATAPGEELRAKLAGNATQVLRRFALVEGFLPLDLDAVGDGDNDNQNHGFSPRTKDNRRLSDFSTGQKAQTAVALMAAQNLSLRGVPRVMILDDVSTSYDLSNLSREALLWRQLAYGGRGYYQRQVFLSSHHEDLTHGLLDLLTPPKGKKMYLIRFKGWSPKTGPVVEQFEVEPTGNAWDDDGKQPSKGLKTFGEALCNQPI